MTTKDSGMDCRAGPQHTGRESVSAKTEHWTSLLLDLSVSVCVKGRNGDTMR